MTQDPHNKFKELNVTNPVIQSKKVKTHIESLTKMRKFYEDKLPGAEEWQQTLFTKFIKALAYACTIIVLYDKLTKKIAELAEEADE